MTSKSTKATAASYFSGCWVGDARPTPPTVASIGSSCAEKYRESSCSCREEELIIGVIRS